MREIRWGCQLSFICLSASEQAKINKIITIAVVTVRTQTPHKTSRASNCAQAVKAVIGISDLFEALALDSCFSILEADSPDKQRLR